MNKKKALTLLLALALVAALSFTGAPAASAAEGGGAQPNQGMVINKTAVPDGNGGYKITLEAFATGSKVITEVTEDIPTDIILVLDQSGSMDDTMTSYDFRPYSARSNNYFYERRHNGGSNNLYYQLPGEDGGYASVSVSYTQGGTYTAISNQRNSYYYTNRNNLYAIVGGEYQKVTVTRTSTAGLWIGTWDDYRYTYTVNGINIHTSDDDAERDTPTFPGVEGGVLYLLSSDASQNVYTYTYTDHDGVLQTIGNPSTGSSTQFTDATLYERYASGTVQKLSALKRAAEIFADNVAAKAKGADGEFGTADDIRHRIAMVGYASNNNNYNDYRYENTEVFIGATQYRYDNGASGQYGNAFQDMSTQAGRNNINASIGALAANGATYTNLGMEMANGILNANPVPAGERRNRVVIVFTDGIPGAYGYDSSVASSALSYGNTIKGGGTTVYTIGVFAGADASSAGSNTNGADDTQRANWFMQNLSSGGGQPNSGYYLSAADSGTLNGIFEQISHNIESGGTTVTLTEETVIRDIIAPAFTLPAGATASDITLETYACTGENAWTKNADAMGASVNIDSTNTDDPTTTNNRLSVTGFDFAEHYVGTVTENGKVTYRGHKLVISFTVTPRAGFLGGNGVETNAGAGVYEDDSAPTPVLNFDKPKVDVPIPEVSVTAPDDKNVYLLGGLSSAQLLDGTAASIGGQDLDLSPDAENFGLAAWQTQYVNISYTEPTALSGLTADATYGVTVTVEPKNAGDSAATSDTDTGKVNVFKPTVDFKDSTVFYGDQLPTDFSGNKTSEAWMHGSTNSANATMIGTVPTLTYTYLPPVGMTTVSQFDDIPIGVETSIGGTDVTAHTTLTHTPCDENETLPTGAAFLLHVVSGKLTITKAGGTDGEPYVFTILREGNPYSEAVIVGNGSIELVELPAGTYTIQEDTGWNWRDTPTYSSAVTISLTNPEGTLTCTNARSTNKWLSGFSQAVKNTFGISNSAN